MNKRCYKYVKKYQILEFVKIMDFFKKLNLCNIENYCNDLSKNQRYYQTTNGQNG